MPKLDYRDYTRFASLLPEDIASFAGASNDLVQLVLGSATTQSILPISPPLPNSTYSIEINAPALSCQEAFANDSVAIDAAYYNYTAGSGGAGITYFAWAPAGNTCTNGSMATPSDFTSSTLPTTIDACFGDSKKLNIFIPVYHVEPTGASSWLKSIILNCSLWDASYTVDFDFRNRAQHVDVRRRELSNGVAGLDDYGPLLSSTSQDNRTLASTLLSYVSIMDAFGRLMVGAITTYHYGTMSPQFTLILSTGLASLLPNESLSTDALYTVTNATFARAVENLFENVTLSLLSSNEFIVDL